MKKNIMFMVISMNIGGTEKALLNMISEMPADKYNITILVCEHKGGFLDYVPSHVTVKTLNGFDFIKPMLNQPPRQIAKELFINKKLINCFGYCFYYLLSKSLDNKNIFYKYLSRFINFEHTKYDTAVAYAGPADFISFFILYKINANKKIQWVHFDVTKIGFNKSFAQKNYINFDEIKLVSYEAKKKFEALVPKVKDITETIPNHISPLSIKRLSIDGQGFIDNFNGIRILTVGRLSIEKGQDKAIKILNRLLKEGYSVRWYCIGDGHARKEYEELVSKYGLQANFIFLGSNPNPYPFIKQCDIYVQPSRYEGYCITIMEAKLFNKPIVATSVNGVKEQIKHRKTGLIPNSDENAIYASIKELIISKDLCKQLSDNLSLENARPLKRRLLFE